MSVGAFGLMLTSIVGVGMASAGVVLAQIASVPLGFYLSAEPNLEGPPVASELPTAPEAETAKVGAGSKVVRTALLTTMTTYRLMSFFRLG